MSRRRPGASRRWAILAAGVVALVLIGLGIANAAQLSVSNGGIFLGNLARCSNGPIAATPATLVSGTTYSAVSLAGLTGCNGLGVQITVVGAAGSVLATGSGTAGANPLVITTSVNYNAANVTGVALLVGTWGVPTTWATPACQVTPVALTPSNPVGGSGKYRNVAFSSVNATCVGGALVLTFSDIYGANYTVSGTVPSGAPFSLSTGGQYRPLDVVASSISLTIGGFTIPHTWTP